MRELIALLLVLGAAFGPAPAVAQPAPASDTQGCAAGRAPDEYVCGGVVVVVRPGQAPPTFAATAAGNRSTPAGAPGRSVRYVPYDRLATAPDGTPCVTVGYAPEGVTPADAAPDPTLTYEYQYFSPCPAVPGSPSPPANAAPGTPAVTPAYLAAQFWQRARLPSPAPHIAPGRAITGKLAYLETRGTTTTTHAEDTVLGRLEVRATGRYYVDWGDGEKSGPHSVEGMPWPTQTITHEWTHVGTYSIVATEAWKATWRLGPASGTLPERRSEGRIDGFPVEQIQAVVISGR